jgi:hypothetical protein
MSRAIATFDGHPARATMAFAIETEIHERRRGIIAPAIVDEPSHADHSCLIQSCR